MGSRCQSLATLTRRSRNTSCRAASRSACAAAVPTSLKPGAALADDDALLAVAFDVQNGVDVDEFPVLRRPSRLTSSIVTANECGSSSRTPSSAASRMSSAMRTSSGSSVNSPVGVERRTGRQLRDQDVEEHVELDLALVAETGTISAYRRATRSTASSCSATFSFDTVSILVTMATYLASGRRRGSVGR